MAYQKHEKNNNKLKTFWIKNTRTLLFVQTFLHVQYGKKKHSILCNSVQTQMTNVR